VAKEIKFVTKQTEVNTINCRFENRNKQLSSIIAKELIEF